MHFGDFGQDLVYYDDRTCTTTLSVDFFFLIEGRAVVYTTHAILPLIEPLFSRNHQKMGKGLFIINFGVVFIEGRFIY